MSIRRAKLLRLGVGDAALGFTAPFYLGGIGSLTHTRPFDVLSVALAVQHTRPFNIGTRVALTHTRPYDILGPLLFRHTRPFDIIQSSPVATGDSPTIGGSTGSQPSSVATTTLSADAHPGDRTVFVTSQTGFQAGQRVYVGSEVRTLSVVASLTFTAPLSQFHAAGTTVLAYPGTVTTAPASPGATVLSITALAALTPGTVISIAAPGGGPTEQRVVVANGGGTITLNLGLSQGFAAGALVSALEPGFIPNRVMVFDKAGHRLGDITKYTVTSPRARAINYSGQMGLHVPVSHPDALLVLDDCLVGVESSVGLEMWAGTFGRQVWADSKGSPNIPDILNLWTQVPVEFSEAERDIADGTTATAIYVLLLQKLNDVKSAHGELQWAADFQGVKPFRGDLPEKGDAWDTLRLIARRSQTEFHWRAELAGNDLAVTLVVRDRFDPGAGATFADGVGGNVENGWSFISDPTNRIRSLRLTGAPTNLTKYLPDWAHWAAHEVTPEVMLTLPDTPYTPGDARFRADLEIQVDWSLSKNEQRRLAQLTEDKLWVLYYSFLYAWHDLKGMPFHDKWEYEGPPENLEPDLTQDKWQTFQTLAHYRPLTNAHIVMRNAEDREYLAVIYYLSQEQKFVRIVGFDTIYQYPLPYASLPVGTVINIYDVANKVATLTATFAWTGPDPWLLYAPEVVTYNGHAMTVRGIVSPPFSGRYVNISEAPWTIDYLPPTTDLDDVGALIGTINWFERDRIRLWDPRRDGVGEKLSKPTVYGGAITTRPRWHIVPYSLGELVESSLVQGIYHYDTVIDLTTVDGWPTEFPFTIRVDEGLSNAEDMVVTGGVGGHYTVLRGTSLATTIPGGASSGDTVITLATGPEPAIVTDRVVIIGGVGYVVAEVTGATIRLQTPLVANASAGASAQFTTAATLHETGASIRLLEGAAFEGFVFPYLWPEGEAYAQELLNRLSRAETTLSIKVINRDDTWSSVTAGSTHPTALLLETVEGVTDTVRVVGYAPDEAAGTMEVITDRP